MKKLLLLICLGVHTIAQAETDATVFWYEEQETGTSAELMRYVISKNFIRIDNGSPEDNFLLYDHEKHTIYSANHDDRTVMVIQEVPWTTPEFSFKHEVKNKILKDAPLISGKHVVSYQVFADNKLCADIQLLPDSFNDEMKLFRDYQISLSGQLVASLHNTPEEYQTPCFLKHQVFNQGDYYSKGLPIQEWHSRGYMRRLKNYTHEKVSDELFTLPPGYEQYSPIGVGAAPE